MTTLSEPHPPKDTLVVQGVSKSFAGLRALENVSLRLENGEILGLIGPNGSGKTTLINIISGLMQANAGMVILNGENIANKPAHKIARAGVARTFQTIRLFRALTVLENAEVAALSVGAPRRLARDRALGALEEMGLSQYADSLAGVLPYGLERRLEVARALAMAPRFLLLDEPGAGLNEQESDELLQILADIPNRKDLGMLVVEHDMRLIMRLCDRVHVLDSGRTIGEGSPDAIREIPAVIEAYLGKARTGA